MSMRRRYRLPMPPGQKAKLICFFLSVALLSLTIVGTNHLRSLLGNLAVTRVSNMVGRVVMEAVSDAVNSGEIQYNDLISLEKDADGGIAALQSNMAEFNRLQSAITKDILDRLGQVSEMDLTIPLGTLTGSALLVGRGPSLSVRMQSLGSCSAHFENQFDQAGINQTTHRILLCVDVSMSILLPGFRTSTQVSNAFSVAETVIVGDVPGSYTYFDSGNPIEQDAFDYSINNG
ncbi:MAG: sporulation protein YunB [Oscillospiraceae bacterium]|nr:sporulation protein YunB [Oscillospiraceae bacterium]MCI8758658.1 sporulation protein YunB [Oscillospiraceae bacterium]